MFHVNLQEDDVYTRCSNFSQDTAPFTKPVGFKVKRFYLWLCEIAKFSSTYKVLREIAKNNTRKIVRIPKSQNFVLANNRRRVHVMYMYIFRIPKSDVLRDAGMYRACADVGCIDARQRASEDRSSSLVTRRALSIKIRRLHQAAALSPGLRKSLAWQPLQLLTAMACVSPSPACPVCLDNLMDARVLPCLHSVCKTCVDKMLVTAADGTVKCPICQATVTLPSGGAESLPKDVTAASTCQNGERRECTFCEDKAKKATTWCKKCHLAFCDRHAGRHITSASTKGEVHNVIPLAMADLESSSESGHVDVVPKCPQHNEPLKFHCGSCDVAICGDCAVIGDHQGHKHVRYVKDIIEERKREVAEKVDRLESEFTRKLERSLQAVDHVSTELTRRADEVRTDIRQAGKRAVEMVEAHVEQMVQDVDDLEGSRLKVLDRQKDELQAFLDSANNAVRFKERIMQLDIAKETLFPLLQSLETRTTSLLSSQIHEEPQQHCQVKLLTAGDIELVSKTKEAIGNICPGQASAQHSEIVGVTSLRFEQGKAVDIVIKTKNHDGRRLTTGGDIISTQISPTVGQPRLSSTITDNNDGSHTVSIASQSTGCLRVEVYVNGEKMAADLDITVTSPSYRFDRNECHSKIKISEDGRKATNAGGGWYSVLGNTSMTSGQFSWKVKGSGYHMFGVSTKPSPTSHHCDYHNVAYCWNMNDSAFYRDGVQCSQAKVNSSDNDTMQLDLDCDRHTLQIKNLRTGQTSTLINLPVKEYFQYAAFCHTSHAEFME